MNAQQMQPLLLALQRRRALGKKGKRPLPPPGLGGPPTFGDPAPGAVGPPKPAQGPGNGFRQPGGYPNIFHPLNPAANQWQPGKRRRRPNRFPPVTPGRPYIP